ncbi:hypothetical protein, partial [Numidum massiliense]|uniref:hypothetical protein n=1 Tax=Numidum massiliense TaxID=1522315 RepID=UPI000AA3966B
DSGEGTKKGSTGGTEKSTNVPKVKPELFKNGRVTVESIKENRNIFINKHPNDIANMLKDAGYEVSIRDSKNDISSAKIIKVLNPEKGKNVMQVQVSPGGGRHGSNPYVKISTDD